MQYLEIYKKALSRYINQETRTHYSLADKPENPFFTFGLFSWLRHSREEYPALLKLRSILENDTSDDQAIAFQAVQHHFMDANNKWNHHSFNSYLLDEIHKTCTEEQWQLHWKRFDPTPIVYFQGILFRGTGDLPSVCFKHGLLEKNASSSLNDYIKDMNGSIGVSTTKDFSIAKSYALPRIDPRHDTLDSWDESFIYVVDYRQHTGIDLEKTFLQRGQTIRASLSAGKAEVNVIHKIDADQIIGAFYVNRKGNIKWIQNNLYQTKLDSHYLAMLKTHLPAKYYNELSQHHLDAEPYRNTSLHS